MTLLESLAMLLCGSQANTFKYNWIETTQTFSNSFKNLPK
jgi:hypothetical protein